MPNPLEQSKIENDPTPKDISQEFSNINTIEFMDFLRTQRKEPFLSITIDWVDVPTSQRLKAFLEDFNALSRGQKRSATIRATEEQHTLEPNVFASGVKWEKI